ncbi:peptidase [Candidatus Puniceispirillum sp.]|uniref:peptidase n=1 Tax=Candidatus Puniceispirillum sp. TaxID=2026719 RepID=UPI003F69D74F
MISEKAEKHLKQFALMLGMLSALAVIFDWYPYTMLISFPFCLIWIYCAWLHTEPQLKWINIIFSCLYAYGIARYYWF